MYRILLIDDHAIVGEGTKRVLEDEPDFYCDYVSTGEEALKRLTDNPYDLYIVDLNMPEINGIELTQKIKAQEADAKIVIYTGYDTTTYFNKLIHLGVVGFLSKTFTNAQLVAAVYAAVNDLAVIPEDWLDQLSRMNRDVQLETGRQVQLTAIEHEVLVKVGRGLTNDQISLQMSVSRRTVERYLTKIFQKLNVTSRADAISVSKDLGLIAEFELK